MSTRSVLAGIALAVLCGIAAACGRQSDLPGGGRGPEHTSVPGAAPTIRLVSEVSTGEWRMPAGDYGNLRYSTLDTIKTTNVMNLHVVTTFSTGVPHGHEGQPLVFGNTMYVVTPFPNNLIAVDLTKPGGAVKWIYEPHPDPRSVGIACCDVVNRGASFGDGKVVYSLLDATVVAVDIETGKEAWRTRMSATSQRQTSTGAPDRREDRCW
jgi:glucose dehydrogenase